MILKTHSNVTEIVINFQGRFGFYGVTLGFKIALKRSGGI